MRGIQKKAEDDYHPMDPLLDPPKSRDKQERRLQSGHSLGGATLGALGGQAIGHLVNPEGTMMGGMPNARAILGRGAIGAGLGGLVGQVSGNRKVYKKRMANDEPLDTPEEEEDKNRITDPKDNLPKPRLS